MVLDKGPQWKNVALKDRHVSRKVSNPHSKPVVFDNDYGELDELGVQVGVSMPDELVDQVLKERAIKSSNPSM